MGSIEIDGSFGEGGGQILRTALGLSCVTGKEFRIFNIRKARKKPGLMPQHMTCVNAASEICGARVSGNETGSTELAFVPGKVRHGSFFFDIKTAGSSSLVFQTVLPPLLFADRPSHVTIKGGTHVPLSPSYHYIAEIFVPMLDRVGVKIEPSISIYGFYPKGGGAVRFKTHPIGKIKGLNAVSKGRLISIAGHSAVSNLPLHIAERQKSAVMQGLSPLHADIDVIDVPSPGQGTFVFLGGEYENALAGFCSLGARGKPAEEVGKEAAALFKDFHNTPACLDPHLADQMVIYLGLSRNESAFTTSRITQHLITNLQVIEKFLKIRYQLEGDLNSAGKIILYPS